MPDIRIEHFEGQFLADSRRFGLNSFAGWPSGSFRGPTPKGSPRPGAASQLSTRGFRCSAEAVLRPAKQVCQLKAPERSDAGQSSRTCTTDPERTHDI